MKKTPVIALAVVLACAVLCICAGCVGSDPIVGDWELDAVIMKIPVSFNADGSGVMEASILGSTLSVDLTWKKNDDGSYSIGVADGKGSSYLSEGKYTLSEDKKELLAGGVAVLTKKN